MVNLTTGDIGRLETTTTPSSTDEITLYDGVKLETCSIDNVLNTAVSRTVQIKSFGKVGATAGWTAGEAADTGYIASLPASQTDSTLIIPVTGIPINSLITGFSIRGIATSAGNAITIDADLIRLDAESNGVNDETTVVSISTQNISANARLSASASVSSSQTVSNFQSFFVVVTGTTAASTSVDLHSITVSYTGT